MERSLGRLALGRSSNSGWVMVGTSGEFTKGATGVLVKETFEAESETDPELQRRGWQAILDNFARYVEAKDE